MNKPRPFRKMFAGSGWAVTLSDHRATAWELSRHPTSSDNIFIIPILETGKHISFHIPFKTAARMAASLLRRMGYEIMPAGTAEYIRSLVDDWPDADSDDESESHISGGDCVDWYCSCVRPTAKNVIRDTEKIGKELGK